MEPFPRPCLSPAICFQETCGIHVAELGAVSLGEAAGGAGGELQAGLWGCKAPFSWELKGGKHPRAGWEGNSAVPRPGWVKGRSAQGKEQTLLQ